MKMKIFTLSLCCAAGIGLAALSSPTMDGIPEFSLDFAVDNSTVSHTILVSPNSSENLNNVGLMVPKTDSCSDCHSPEQIVELLIAGYIDPYTWGEDPYDPYPGETTPPDPNGPDPSDGN